MPTRSLSADGGLSSPDLSSVHEWSHPRARGAAERADLCPLLTGPDAGGQSITARLELHQSREHQGNTNAGTAATRGHSPSGDSFFFRGFRARGFPACPRFPPRRSMVRRGRRFESVRPSNMTSAGAGPIGKRCTPGLPLSDWQPLCPQREAGPARDGAAACLPALPRRASLSSEPPTAVFGWCRGDDDVVDLERRQCSGLGHEPLLHPV